MAEEALDQNISEEQKVEFQKYMEFQKFNEMQKNSESAKDSELIEFEKSGLNVKHYQKANRLNLDLTNYNIYCSNKSNKIKGTILMGIGGGLVAEGLILFLCSALMESIDDNYSSYYEDEETDDIIKNTYITIGGVSCAVGVGLFIGGTLKLGKIEKVFKKDGTKMSLSPKVDFFDQEYGAEISLSF